MNNFGNIFRISVFGESHGSMIGVVIDGMPSGIEVSQEDFLPDLQARRAGKLGTTKRVEDDIPIIASGIFRGNTTGSPITILFENKSQKSNDYAGDFQYKPRPGHADFASQMKFGGFSDFRGSGHFSGRITLALVAAGVLAKKLLPCQIESKLIEVGGENDFDKALLKAIEIGDSLGAVIETRVTQLPYGIGEPFFASCESVISSIVFSIPGVKGIEFGAGFASARMKGSEYNDEIIDISGKTNTNNSGGINGGISNGNDIVFKTALHPTSSISKEQNTIDIRSGEKVKISITGRHDVCFALRVPPIVTAATACALADLYLYQTRCRE